MKLQFLITCWELEYEGLFAIRFGIINVVILECTQCSLYWKPVKILDILMYMYRKTYTYRYSQNTYVFYFMWLNNWMASCQGLGAISTTHQNAGLDFAYFRLGFWSTQGDQCWCIYLLEQPTSFLPNMLRNDERLPYPKISFVIK